MTARIAIAIGAHPDDIEFSMAGTLLLLRQARYQIHYLNLGTGSCGSRRHAASALRRIRRSEARTAAGLLGAEWHASLVDDLEILYDLRTLRRLAALLREIKPSIVLTHSPQDYMEDHMTTCRLAVSAAFSLGMPNFRTTPPRRAVTQDVTLYHALPHGLRDGLRRRIGPEMFVDTTSVQATKRAALAAHTSQQDWLDISQGMSSYVRAMETLSREVGRLSHKFTHAEGWRRHSHLGFSEAEADPLQDALGNKCSLNRAYLRALERGL